MPEPEPYQARRSSDSTIQVLKNDVDNIQSKVQDIDKRVERIDDRVDDVHKLLITEPEASPLGRALLGRAITNSGRIDVHDRRLDVLEDWRTEWRGVWRFLIALSVVLALIASFFSLGSRLGAW